MNQCNVTGKINSLETMGLVDGPGIRIVIFMQGCRLRCIYCHNPETWQESSNNIVTVEELVNKILKYKSYISKNGGVTFSGGEPLLQSAFLYECIKELKKHELHVCIDTSGVGYNYEKLVDLVDLFIVDVKSTNREMYKYITGLEMDEFNKFMQLIQSKNKKMWIRQVIVPNLNDNEENIIELANYVNSLNNVEKVELLPYHTLGKEKYEKLNIKYRLDNIDNLSKVKINYLQNLLNKHLLIYR